MQRLTADPVKAAVLGGGLLLALLGWVWLGLFVQITAFFGVFGYSEANACRNVVKSIWPIMKSLPYVG